MRIRTLAVVEYEFDPDYHDEEVADTFLNDDERLAADNARYKDDPWQFFEQHDGNIRFDMIIIPE